MPAAMTDDGTSISYKSAGEGPPNLLCMHGWAGSGRYFDATIEQLDLTRARAVTFDLRGHGAPTRPPTATRSTGSPPTRSPSPTPRGSTSSSSSASA